MKAKHLFLTITMLLAVLTMAWGTTVTDHISLSNLTSPYSLSTSSKSFSLAAYDGGHDAKYSGQLYYYYDYDEDEDETTTYLKLRGGSDVIASTVTGGELKSVSVEYAIGSNNVYVFARSSSAYTGSETYSTLDPGELVATISSSTPVDLSAGHYKYVAIVGDGTRFSDISIEWTASEKMDITKSSSFPSGVTLKVDDTTAGKGKAFKQAVAGDLVEIYISAKDGYCVTGFNFGDMYFDLECFGYIGETEEKTFYVYMPNTAVEISATVIPMPTKYHNAPTFKYAGATITSSTVGSGATKKIDFELPYFNGAGTTGGVYYTGTVTCTSSNTSALEIDSYDVDMETGKGYAVVRGLVGPSANLQVHIGAAVNMYAETYTLAVSVTPRQAALIAKVDDKYYAMLNDVAGGVASAQEVFKGADGKYYYKIPRDGGTAIANMTWNIMNQDAEGETFTIQKPADSKYLALPVATLKLQDASSTWMSYKGALRETGAGKLYPAYQTAEGNFSSDDYATYGVFDVTIGENFLPLSIFRISTSSSAIDEVGGVGDQRTTLTVDMYGTVCVPFNAPIPWASGANFYTLVGKTVSGDRLTGVVMEEMTAEDVLEAGHSYMFYTTATTIDIFYSDVADELAPNAYTGTDDGFVGCSYDDGSVSATPDVSPRSDGYYALKSNLLHYITAKAATIRMFRAMIKASELDVYVDAPSPRRRIVLRSDDSNEATSVEQITDGNSSINWNEPVYNVMGVRVGEGTTGVLIQGGKKFLVQ